MGKCCHMFVYYNIFNGLVQNCYQLRWNLFGEASHCWRKKTLVDTPNPMKFQAYVKNKLGMDGLISQRLLLKPTNYIRKWWYDIKYIYLFIVVLVDVNNYNTWIDLRESRLKYINYYASNVMLNENNIHVVRNIDFFWD